MSFTRKEEELEEFNLFMEFKEELDNELEEQFPSKLRIRQILAQMSEVLK